MAESGNINSLNIKLTADPEALKKGLDTAVKALQTGGDKMKQQTEKMAASMNKWNKSATDVTQTASRQSRALQNLANSYAAMGSAGAEGLRATAAEAIEVKRRMEDVQGIIQASDLEGKFKTAAAAVSKVTQGIAGAQGAMHMLGISTEGAAEVTAKLQSLMALSQGLQAIVSLDGEIMALTGSMDLASVKAKALQFALSPIGAGIIVGIAALGAIFMKLSGDLEETRKKAEKVRQEFQQHQGYIKALGEGYDELNQSNAEGVELEVLRAKAAGKSEAEIYRIRKKALEDQIKNYRANSVDMKRDLDERILNTTQAIKLETELEKLKLNEQIRLNEIYKQQQEDKRKLREKEKAQQLQMLIDIEQAQREYDQAQLERMRRQEIKPVAEKMKPIAVPVTLTFDEAQAGRTAQRVMVQVQALNQGIQSGIASAVDNVSNLIVDMFASPEDALRNFGNAMLATLGQFMSTLGKAIIAAGTASQVFQKALLANPAAAIAAGAALVVAGAAVTGIMKKGMNARAQQEGNGGTNTAPQGIRPFATGGIVSGPTLGLMGEYAGARSNPEVVAPLDKLKSMLGGTGTLTTRVSGTDLLIMLDRAERNRGRVR